MPLSEDEQRILSEIEAKLYESDPALARDIADTNLYTMAKRRLVVATFGFLGGLAFLCVTLQTSFVLALAGVGVMVVALMSIEASLRRIYQTGVEHLTDSMRSSGLREYFGDRRQRMRDRMQRGEDLDD